MKDAALSRSAAGVDVDARDGAAYAGYVLLVLLGLYMMNYADRYVAAGLVEAIKAEFDASDAFLGFLIGPAFAIFYTTAAVPIARYADRARRVRIIACGALVWSGFTMLSGLASDAWAFAAARVGVGLGEAAFLAPAYSLLSDYFPPRRRAVAFGVLGLGVYFGQLLGLIGGGAIAEATHWRNAFLLLGLPGVALAIAALITVREPERGRYDPIPRAADRPADFVEVMRGLRAMKSYRLILIGSALGGFGGMAFGMWGPTLFVRAFDLPLTEANARFGVAFGMSGLVGALGCGWLSDRLAVRDPAARLRLAAIALVSNSLVMIAICFVPDAALATALAVPAGILGGGWAVSTLAALQDQLHGGIRATATSFWSLALAFSGLVLGVQFTGLATDALTASQGDDAIRYGAAAALIACLPGGWALWRSGDALHEGEAA